VRCTVPPALLLPAVRRSLRSNSSTGRVQRRRKTRISGAATMRTGIGTPLASNDTGRVMPSPSSSSSHRSWPAGQARMAPGAHSPIAK